MSSQEEDTSVDPAGHIKISVSDIKKSKVFYDTLFETLGYEKVDDHPDAAGWATREGLGVWIEEAEKKKPAYVFGAPGLHHICFKAQSREEVDDAYQFLLKKNVYIFDPPEAYPNYTKKYYAVFFADPDGIKLELAYY